MLILKNINTSGIDLKPRSRLFYILRKSLHKIKQASCWFERQMHTYVHKYLVWGFLFVVLISFSSFSEARTMVKSINTRYINGHSRILIRLSYKPLYYWFTLKNPERLVVDFKNMLYKHVSNPSLINMPVKNIRWSRHNKKTVRVVFDLTKAVKSKVYLIKEKRSREYQLEIVFGDTFSKTNTSYKHAKASPAAKIFPRTARDVVVVIDPGHGGKDPGAVGYRRYQEKNVVLSIAQDLEDLLNKETGVKAILTRNGDSFVSLRGRINFARKNKADLFISIHANSLRTSKARGVMLFALSNHGASSETGRWLANRENNESLIGGVSGINLNGKSDKLARILLDLSINNTIAHSVILGDFLLDSLKSSHVKIHTKKVGRAAFIVLKSPDIPSLLIETGFITTPADARLLTSKLYQHRFARSIESGITSYLNKYPPAGTLLVKSRESMKKSALTYKVKQGDTLSKIAQHFNLSVKTLQAINNLDSSADIYVEQVLKIRDYQTYKVRKGDTLLAIAKRFGTSFKKIMAINKMKSSERLLTGVELQIP